MDIAMTHGLGSKHINVISNSKEDFREIGNLCYDISCVVPIIQEMTDEELLALVAQSKTYDFWNNRADDIYSVSDGTLL